MDGHSWKIPMMSAAALAAVSAASFVYRLVSDRKLPPGPYGLPFIGYFPFLSDKPCCKVTELNRKYGPVVSLRVGSRLVIVLGDSDSVKESFILNAEAFSDRPQNNSFCEVLDYHYAGNHGDHWRVMTTFLNQTVRDYGRATIRLVPVIQNELDEFMSSLEQMAEGANNNPVSFHSELEVSVANTSCVLAFGRCYDYSDEMFKRLKANLDAITSLHDKVTWRFLFPFLNRFHRISRSALRARGDEFQTLVREVVIDHMASPDMYMNYDFIHTYLKEQTQRQMAFQSDEPFTRDRLYGCLLSLFGGGYRPVESAISWTIVMLMHYPLLQERIHLELDRVIGRETNERSNHPRYEHRALTPLLLATIMEVERFVSIVPLSMAHSNNEEVMIQGYRIPKGSYIVANFWGIHHDPDQWVNPDRFCPERFLHEGGVLRPENLLSYSTGVRTCPGDDLAEMEVYLYVASMLQQFQILPLEGGPLPPLPLEVRNPGMVWRCPAFQARLLHRGFIDAADLPPGPPEARESSSHGFVILERGI